MVAVFIILQALMLRKNTLSFILLTTIATITGHFSYAQIAVTEVNDTLTPAKIVKEYLMGTGISVSNVQYRGENDALGIFTDPRATLGFTEGIILSTGIAQHVTGPNARHNSGANFGRFSFLDEDLVTRTDMCDGALLEFDFIPKRDSIIFDFIFGSEEYPEFVNKEFNDIFAFYLYKKTPPRSKSYNMGKLPNGKTVMINNVNHLTNSEWYVANDKPALPYYDFVEYDGFTKTITAAANVEPNKLYHLKIIIADLGDCEYDSGVLLRSKSFNSIPSSAVAAKMYKPILKNMYLQFDLDAYTLNATEQWKVKRLGDSISIYRFDSIVVVGHTDSTGNETHNRNLSLKRAQMVKSILEKRTAHMVDIRAYGNGSRTPLYPNNTDKNKEKNRRVEILFYQKRIQPGR